MIEQVMFFSLGFLVASLVALAIAPAFWHRAVRLVTRKLEQELPLTAREALASRDLIRAELAVERRRLEQKIEALDAIHARDMVELGRSSVAIAGKDAELETAQRDIALLDVEVTDLRRLLAEATDALDTTTAALHDANMRWDRSELEVQELRRELETLQRLCAEQAEALAEAERKLVHEHEAQTREAARKVRLEAATAAIASGQPSRGTATGGTDEHYGAAPSPLAADETFRREMARLEADLMACRGTGPAGASESERLALRRRISEIGAMAIRLADAAATPARGEAAAPRMKVDARNSRG